MADSGVPPWIGNLRISWLGYLTGPKSPSSTNRGLEHCSVMCGDVRAGVTAFDWTASIIFWFFCLSTMCKSRYSQAYSARKKSFACFVQQQKPGMQRITGYFCGSSKVKNSGATMLGHSWLWNTKQTFKNQLFDGFRTWGYPKWFVYTGISHSSMDDLVVSLFQETIISATQIGGSVTDHESYHCCGNFRGSNGCWVAARCWYCKAGRKWELAVEVRIDDDHRWAIGLIHWWFHRTWTGLFKFVEWM